MRLWGAVSLCLPCELAKGLTAADWNAGKPNAHICLEVDAEALMAMFT